MIIAVDFDNCLAKTNFHIGDSTIVCANENVISYIKRKQEEGAQIVLWTCRHGEYLSEALVWCKEQGLCFDAVNDDVPEIIKKWGDNRSKKITADMYIDDLAVNSYAL